MKAERPLILITNDDSIAAPGIHHLVDCVRDFADVYVVAPEQPQSGKSAALTVSAPLKIKEVAGEAPDGVRMFTVDGTPVDCVKLAFHTILPKRPDLILSGINHGSNAAINVTYSGTMGAVLEGCMQGVASVGFSLLSHSMDADFSQSADYITKIVKTVMANGLPDHVCLNVNIPAGMKPLGTRVCRAARGHWSEEYKRYVDPSGHPFYWLTGRFVNAEPQATDTDEYWLSQGYISIVPENPDVTVTDLIAPFKGLFE